MSGDGCPFLAGEAAEGFGGAVDDGIAFNGREFVLVVLEFFVKGEEGLNGAGLGVAGVFALLAWGVFFSLGGEHGEGKGLVAGVEFGEALGNEFAHFLFGGPGIKTDAAGGIHVFVKGGLGDAGGGECQPREKTLGMDGKGGGFFGLALGGGLASLAAGVGGKFVVFLSLKAKDAKPHAIGKGVALVLHFGGMDGGAGLFDGGDNGGKGGKGLGHCVIEGLRD